MRIDPETKSDSLLFIMLVTCLIILLMAVALIQLPNIIDFFNA